MKFDMGYPRRTGDSEKDLNNLYNHVCEMCDRLKYILNLLENQIARKADASAGETVTDTTE